MSMLRLIHAADMHLDSAFEALPAEAAEKRRTGQRSLLFRIAEFAEKYGAQAVLISGDVFDGDAVSKDSEDAFCRAFGALSVPVFVSPGNHDPYTPMSVWARMSLPENVHLFKKETIECIELQSIGLRVWGAGFENTFCRPLLEDFEAPEKKDGMADVMVIHGDISAGASDYNAISRKQIENSGMDYIALGHIHSRSALQKSGKTAFAYPGCTEGRGYDETGEMGALLITLTNGEVKEDFLPLGGARYEILTVDVGETDAIEAVNAATLDYTDKDYLRVILTGECDELPDVSALRRAFEGRFAEMQLRDETVQKRDVWEQTGQDSLAGVFLRMLRERFDAADSADERRKIELAARFGLAAMESGGGR